MQHQCVILFDHNKINPAYGLNHVHEEYYTHGDMKLHAVLITSVFNFILQQQDKYCLWINHVHEQYYTHGDMKLPKVLVTSIFNSILQQKDKYSILIKS